MATSSPAAIPEFLGRHAPFSQMTHEHLAFLAEHLVVARYPQGTVLLGPDDGPAQRLYIIREGRVRGVSPSGQTAGNDNAWELVSGECFPVGALLARRPVHTISRAVEDTTCFTLERAHFEALLERSAAFRDFCTRRIANLLDDALRGIQAHSAAEVSEAGSLNVPLRTLIRRPAVSCRSGATVGEAVQTIHNEHVGSIVVTDTEQRPLGIFTLHDLLSRVVLRDRALSTPIDTVATRELVTLGREAFAYEAALLMTRRGIRHLCVTDAQGRLVGVLSERDLFSLQRIGLVSLSRAINRAETVDALARFGQDIQRLVEQMLAQGASVDQLTQIVSQLNDGLTQRIIALVLAEQRAACPAFTWLSFGSEGRREQTLKTDQDNGILFPVPSGTSAATVRGALLPLAERINQALARCGFPLCPGNIMAGNPECCLSLDEWKAKFERWIDQGTPEHLLKASIFFDFRPLYGDATPVQELHAWLAERVYVNSRFRQQMAANALRNRPPLGLFGDFKVSSARGAHPHSLDLKLHGVTPFVDGARLFALSNRITETNTIARLRQAARNEAVSGADADAWIESYQYIQLLRMRAHQQQAQRGEPLSNFFDPGTLNALNQRVLKEAFRQARRLQSKIALEYQL